MFIVIKVMLSVMLICILFILHGGERFQYIAAVNSFLKIVLL